MNVPPNSLAGQSASFPRQLAERDCRIGRMQRYPPFPSHDKRRIFFTILCDTEMNLYRNMNRAALDAAYNNSAAVPDSAEIIASWQDRSKRLRSLHPAHLDLRYGEAERNRIDYFDAGAGTPLLVFIHGGYWQMREKETFSFLAAGPLAHGLSVALVGYTLAPEKRLSGMVEEIATALDFLAPKSNALYVSGWSAGGHLAAMAMAHPAVKGGIAISGIYDLEPIRLCYVNDKLGLDDDEARRHSPIALAAPDKPLLLAYGGNERPELQRQSETYFHALQSQQKGRYTLHRLDGHNHFSILEDLASPDGALIHGARRLMDTY